MADETRKVADDVAKGGQAGLMAAADMVLEGAKNDIGVGDPSLDPDPSFALAEHGHIVPDPDGRSVLIVFEGPYARRQHEDLNLDHPRGGGAKFLERQLVSILPRFEGIVAGEIKRRLGGTR